MSATTEFDRFYLREKARTERLFRRSWRTIYPTMDFSRAWSERQRVLLPELESVQARVVAVGATLAPAQLAEQGLHVTSSSPLNVSGFVGANGDGRTISEALDMVPVRARALMANGAQAAEALTVAERYGTLIVQTMLADLVRNVQSVSVAARPRTVYVRHIAGETCDKCIVLAGKVFRYNAGFLRHPGCDCYHVATVQDVARDATTDPYEAFNAMSEADQDRAFGRANAQAIRDGADIYQVVNSRRGMTATGAFTTEGATRRGAWGRTPAGQIPGRRRMTPQSIYDLAGSREEAVEMLREFGYLLPAGQVSGGSLRGVVFDPRTTMTAAQKRLADAHWQLEELRAGRNPTTTQSLERRYENYPRISRGAPERPLTPSEAAAIEQRAQLMIAANGEAVTYRQYARAARGVLLPDPR